jgi:hypothetical protein
MSLALQMPAQTAYDWRGSYSNNSDVVNAPLPLLVNGSGCVWPFHDGQMLEVGRRYVMVAIPRRGFTFTNWNPVNVFTITVIVSDPFNGLASTNTSRVLSPVPKYTKGQVLWFKMQPEELIEDTYFIKITRSYGWQANFVPSRKKPRD